MGIPRLSQARLSVMFFALKYSSLGLSALEPVVYPTMVRKCSFILTHPLFSDQKDYRRKSFERTIIIPIRVLHICLNLNRCHLIVFVEHLIFFHI